MDCGQKKYIYGTFHDCCNKKEVSLQCIDERGKFENHALVECSNGNLLCGISWSIACSVDYNFVAVLKSKAVLKEEPTASSLVFILVM